MSIYIPNTKSQQVNILSGQLTNNVKDMNSKLYSSAFGELNTSTLYPIVQISGIYDDVNPRIFEQYISGTGASITSSNAKYKLNNGSDVYGYATLRTIRQLKYRAGQGILFRFTTIFDKINAVADSLQLGGVGVSGNHLCFGYNGTSFGITKKSNGTGEVRRLEITTAENSITTAVITLNGVAFNVPLTNSGGAKEFTAFEITKITFTGWTTSQLGVYVYFNKDATGPATSTYSYANGGGASVGTFTQTTLGVIDNDLWIPQNSWNGDVMDGSGESSMILDTSKGNVYQIQYQWLGFGRIKFFIENQYTGNFILVHTLHYTNQNTEISIRKPSMKPTFACASLGSTTPITMYIGSFAGFNEGRIERNFLPLFSFSHAKTITANTETIIFNLRNRLLVNGIINTSEMLIFNVSVASDGTKSVVIKIYYNSIPGSNIITDYPNYSSISNTSYTVFDITSQTVSNGYLVDTFIIQKVGSAESFHEYFLQRNDTFIITATSTGGSIITASVNWREDY